MDRKNLLGSWLGDLEIVLADGESNSVEFKSSPDKALLDEICAFANASGEKIPIGEHNEKVIESK